MVKVSLCAKALAVFLRHPGIDCFGTENFASYGALRIFDKHNHYAKPHLQSQRFAY